MGDAHAQLYSLLVQWRIQNKTKQDTNFFWSPKIVQGLLDLLQDTSPVFSLAQKWNLVKDKAPGRRDQVQVPSLVQGSQVEDEVDDSRQSHYTFEETLLT